MNKIVSFFKREVLLSISILAAAISLFITPPSTALIGAISWKTLFSLLMLFIVLEGFKKENMLSPIARVATRIKSPFVLSLFITLVVFFLSAFITNDVALLAFVPITIAIFSKTDRKKYIIPVVAIETIAANLGSMITPFGNPQNLFLFEKMGISAKEFLIAMAPIWAISLVLIVLTLAFIFRHDFKDELILRANIEETEGNKSLRMLYFCLFFFALFGILGYANWIAILIMFSAIVLVFDKSVIKKIDWPLLATFLCFFIFSSSLSANENLKAIAEQLVAGHELIAGIMLSQLISNVPAAILLEPFASNMKSLLYGVDIGGLGTLVASLASLISFRLYAKEEEHSSKRYLLVFTLYNALFLAILIFFAIIII